MKGMSKMAAYCINCGSSSFIFKNGIECCNLCGMPLFDPDYEKQVALAAAHSAAANYEDVDNVTRPLLKTHPADKRLYIALFRAATNNYHDFFEKNHLSDNDKKRCSDASWAWNKLLHLEELNDKLFHYNKNRFDKMKPLIFKRMHLLKIIVLVTLFFIVLSIFSAAGSDGILCSIFILTAMASASGIAFISPIKTLKLYRYYKNIFDKKSNPFDPSEYK